jgi:AraC-like DNA-binding protein
VVCETLHMSSAQEWTSSDCPWLSRLVVACQEIAGAVLHEDTRTLGPSIQNLERLIPVDVPPQHRLVLRNLVGRVVAQTARWSGIAARPDVTAALVKWMASDVCASAWRQDMHQLFTSCASALDAAGRSGDATSVDPRVGRALATIRERYRDPRLTLGVVARASDLSPCYLAHIMKRQTGLSFGAHLHRARLTAVSHMLEHTSLSIKEVASLAGYGGSSQLGRHFKRAFGATPFAYRQQVRAAGKNRPSIERIDDESALKRLA